MDRPAMKRTRLPTWAVRSIVGIVLVGGVLVPMVTLAIASMVTGPSSAIRPSTLDRMLHPGAIPVPVSVPVRTAEGT
jgi:hypothetical protein